MKVFYTFFLEVFPKHLNNNIVTWQVLQFILVQFTPGLLSGHIHGFESDYLYQLIEELLTFCHDSKICKN